MNYEFGIKIFFPLIRFRTKYVILIIFLFSFIGLYSDIAISYTPQNVGEHWSRRVVEGEDEVRRMFYRPRRFDWMEMDVTGAQSIQLRGFLVHRGTDLDITIRVGNVETRHNLQVQHVDDRFFWLEIIELDIPEGVTSIYIRTRNPHAFFRHFRVNRRQMRPRLLVLEAESYWERYILYSAETESEYFGAYTRHAVTYRADVDGDVHFFVRSLREDRTGATIEILVNNQLHQTTVLPNRTSRDFWTGNVGVSTGTRIEIPGLSAGDTITIIPRTEHIIITRMFLTTKELF